MRTNLIALVVAACAATAGIADTAKIDISDIHVAGVSGIEVTEDGNRFIGVTDAGWFVEGDLERDGGTLISGRVEVVRPIIGQNGFPVRARVVGDWWDAEGIAMMPDGTLFVSFERWTRVARYSSTEAVGEWIKDHPDFRTWDENRQLESVAVDANGRVFAMPEFDPNGDGIPVYELDETGWITRYNISASEGYSVAGADFGPSGKMYILERRLVFATWYQSRIRTFDPSNGATSFVWESELGEFGNLEGLSLWTAPDGLRGIMVSDNNGRENVSTEIVEIRLTE